MINKIIYCLDPSCFTSLEKLRDTKHILNEIRKDVPSLKVYVPTDIYNAIISPPEIKFRILPSIISSWIDNDEEDNIKSLTNRTRSEYVFVMQEFLRLHSPIPINELIGSSDKIGKESIHLNDLITKFGQEGGLLFEIMAVSSEYKARIIALTDTTFSLMREIGTHIERGISKVKNQLKTRQNIRSHLLVAMLFMEHYGIMDFVKDFQIEGVEIPVEVIPPAGLIYLANG